MKVLWKRNSNSVCEFKSKFLGPSEIDITEKTNNNGCDHHKMGIFSPKILLARCINFKILDEKMKQIQMSVRRVCICKEIFVYVIFSRGYAGMLPIHAAALNGYVDCVRKLRAAMPAIDINITDDAGRTCLHGAACSG